jgi:large subunit ribosomal protein L22
MPGVKTNEVAGTRAVLRHFRMSAYKARQVLDLVRGQDVDRAAEILRATPREGARVVGKVLASAVANARNNDFLDPEDLYVSACYADEGTTIKRWRPRARGRATRIRKRTCHITVIVSRLPDDRLERRRARLAEQTTAGRSRRVAASRRSSAAADDAGSTSKASSTKDTAPVDEPVDADVDAVDDVTDAELTADAEGTGDVDATGDEDASTASDEAPSDEAESDEAAEAGDDEAATADAEEKD